MPIRSYSRDDVRRRIEVIGDGPLSAGDLISVVRRQIADRAWTYGLLYEATALPEAIDELLVHVPEASATLGPVAVVSQGPDAVNIARYMASATVEIALFVNRRSAEEWLDARQQG